MTNEVMVAIFSLAGTLVGSFAGILTSNKLVNYRISQLEIKVDKHNSVQERVALLEQNDAMQWRSLEELKGICDEIKKEVYAHE